MTNVPEKRKKIAMDKNDLYSFMGLIIPNELVASNSKQAGEFYHKNDNVAPQQSSPLSSALEIQWIRISIKEIEQAEDYNAARNAWENAPTMSSIKCLALEKMLSLTDDRKRIMSIFRSAPFSSLVKIRAFDKFQTLTTIGDIAEKHLKK